MRFPGTFAEGAISDDCFGSRSSRVAVVRRPVRRRDCADLRCACACPTHVARRRRASRLGLSTAITCRRHRPCRVVFRSRAEPLRRIRVRLAAAGCRRPAHAQSLRRRAVVGRARGDHCVALHGAFHGRGAGLRACAADCGDDCGIRCAWHRHGAAVRSAFLVSRMAARVAAARRVDDATKTSARVSALRDRRVVDLGYRRTSRQ